MKPRYDHQCKYNSEKICVVKTNDGSVFIKITLLCAIPNSECVGATLYKERFEEFLETNTLNEYKNHSIILNNAGSNNNEYVKQAITNKIVMIAE